MKIKVLFSALALSALMMDAQAHVTIRNYSNGVDSISGKSDHFRLNVPTNRGKAVTKVKMVVAEGVKLLFIHPVDRKSTRRTPVTIESRMPSSA